MGTTLEEETASAQSILFVSHSARLQGAERSLLSLVRAARARRVRIVVVLPAAGPLEAALRDLGVVDIYKINLPWWVRMSRSRLHDAARFFWHGTLGGIEFGRLVRRLNPDLVVVNSSVTLVPLLVSRLVRVQSVAYIRESLRDNMGLRPLLPLKVIFGCLKVLPNSRFVVSQYVASQCPFSTVVESPDVSGSIPATRVDSPDANLRAVMLGAISAEKNQTDAVRAVARARRGGAAITLRIFGAGSDAAVANLLAEIQRSGPAGIDYAGVLEDPAEAYSWADVSIVCSKSEAYGRVTAESIRASVPVVGYAAGGTVEILAGGGGILCEPTAESLSSALWTLAHQPEALMRLRQEAEHLPADATAFGNAGRTVDRFIALMVKAH